MGKEIKPRQEEICWVEDQRLEKGQERLERKEKKNKQMSQPKKGIHQSYRSIRRSVHIQIMENGDVVRSSDRAQ